MSALTERQRKILSAIVEEYIDTSEPVGSNIVVLQHGLKVSPATVRNEMSVLTREGYLKQPHTSAGRVPTSLGLRFYVKSLMDEDRLHGPEEASLREHLYSQRFEKEQLLRNTVMSLAEYTQNLAIAAMDHGNMYYAGQAYMLDYPAFWDIELARFILSLLDHYETYTKLFADLSGAEQVGLMIGNEIGQEPMRPCSIVYTRFTLGQDQGTLSIVGSRSMRYQRVLPALRYFKNVLDDLSRAW